MYFLRKKANFSQFRRTVNLQITLAIEGCREGPVVKSTRDSIWAIVWGHSFYAVFCLIWRQLSAKFLSCDVCLSIKKRKI